MTLVTQLSGQILGRAGSQGTHTEASSVTPGPGLGGHGHKVMLTQFVQVHSIFVEEGDTWKLWSYQIAQPMHLWCGGDPAFPGAMWSVEAIERKIHTICGETTARVHLSHCWRQKQGGKQGAELSFMRKLPGSTGQWFQAKLLHTAAQGSGKLFILCK